LKSRSILLVTVTILVVIDLVVELRILPLLYQGIPVPFYVTSKPIGNAVFSITSLRLMMIASNLVVLMAVLKRTGYRGDFVPSRKGDWLDIFALLLLGIAGLAMWFYPMFFAIFIGTAVYLLLAEMR
jgi:hypothetical protein